MNILIIILMVISYLIVDFGIRYLTYDSYQFYSYTYFAPTLFSLGWISLFIGLFYLIAKKYRRLIYLISLFIFNLIGYSQYLHFKILDRFYGISDLFLVKEGGSYFKYAIFKSDIKIFVIMIMSLGLGILVFFLSRKYHELYRDKIYFGFVLVFTILCVSGFFICAHFRLGQDEGSSSFDSALNAISVYNDFNNPNKNMQVVGMYENVFRGVYVYIRNNSNSNKDEAEDYVVSYIKENKKDRIDNEYTGKFKDKNIIFVLMESIDDFLVNDEIMPTLSKLESEGINFTNRYSPVFGGGATINSEFAVNTGLYTSMDNNVYNLDNTYRTSLANMFKDNGYSVVSIHYNNGYYYNREEFHKNLGYSYHYALLDRDDVYNDKYDYSYDSNLINSDSVYDLIVREDKFLSFITTYSAHLPYDISNYRCLSNKYDLVSSDGDSEFTCVMNMARETDEMLRLLIERLDEGNRLDDTILVLVSDHYMYGYSYVNEKKKTDNEYLLQHTPFVIWGSDMEHEDIDLLADTADILPTILNLFGIDYDPNLYVGEDVFSNNRDEYIYFSDDIYFDGKKLYNANSGAGSRQIYDDIRGKIKFNNNLIISDYLKLQ